MKKTVPINKIDYAVLTIALSHALRIISDNHKVPFSKVHDDLIKLSSEQAKSLKAEYIEQIANAYLNAPKDSTGLGCKDVGTVLAIEFTQ
ncbi:hypothetical protein [Calothrix sp. UHCC 0171]|uniref:hypothetical protein n=1 Tax=Calothrix sp. UHCC 0171 TaxID=3110245 RepID=UPI002B1FD3EE|nr:hypothetical protein [Calothrix sp. UHCC 0171]MEA5574795.1 hypothetical protein [Calothrix sp. UHCC 0171]